MCLKFGLFSISMHFVILRTTIAIGWNHPILIETTSEKIFFPRKQVSTSWLRSIMDIDKKNMENKLINPTLNYSL